MTPNAIVDRLEAVIGVRGGPRRLSSAIEAELNEYFGLMAIQATERAEQVTPAVARVIAHRATNSEQAGTLATLVLLGTTSDLVAGWCHVLPLDAIAVAAAKEQRRHVGALLEAMRSLNFDEFEKLGACVLAEVGATFCRITPHRGDQGIDFYGNLTLGQLQDIPPPFIRLAHDVVLSFAGQAKHYPNGALGPDIVRELIGAISLARTKTFSKSGLDIFSGLDLKPFSPLVTFVFTTGRITNGALHLAESAGIIARSGEQLAVFLADKGVGITQTGAGVMFDEAKFAEWLHAGQANADG
jgi:Restriction endonuclease